MKIYYINKNTTKCLLNTESKHDIKLYSLGFLPYIRLFHGDTQLTLIFYTVIILAFVAASQQVVGFKTKKDKMKDELDNYNFMKKYNEMLDDKYTSNTNAEMYLLNKENNKKMEV